MTAEAGRRVTLKVRDKSLAAAYVLSPTCEATMVQVPTATVVMFRPETVQIPVVLEVNVTVKPESAVAPEANVSLTNLCAGWAKVIAWAVPVEMLKLLVTEVAAEKVVSPSCEATIVQVPSATVVMFKPETVQIPVVLEAKETANPESAVAAEAKVSPTNLSAGCAKVMVCDSTTLNNANFPVELIAGETLDRSVLEAINVRTFAMPPTSVTIPVLDVRAPE